MCRLISTMLLFILALLTLRPHSVVMSQTPEERLLPRFGAGWAVLRRPVSDYNFRTALTPNNKYVVGMSYAKDAIFYIWDIHDLGDEQIQPEPQSLDLNQYATQDVGARHLYFTVVNDELAVVRVDAYLLQISIPDLTILQTLDLGASDGNWGTIISHENLILTVDDGLDQAVIWNLDTNPHTIYNFDSKVIFGGRWSDGWYLTTYHGANAVFCDDLLTQCTSAEIEGSISLIMDDIIVIGDHDPYQKEPLYPTRYYTLDDLSVGLVKIESPFPFLPDDHVPVSMSPDGKYLSVLTPEPTAEPSGFTPLRTWMLWDIAEQKPRYSIWGLDHYWFRDHFFASELNLYSAESPMRLDELDKGFLWNYNFHHEVDGIEQISDDGTRLLYNTGGAAVIFALEYQVVDDLLHVTETNWQLTHDELTNIQLAPTGEYILAREGNLLKRWELDESEPATLDISEYMIAYDEQGHTGFQLLVRETDAFVQAGHSLIRIDLASFTILEVHDVDSLAYTYTILNSSLPAEGTLSAYGEYVGALFEHDLLVWREDGTLFDYEIEGRTLIPQSDGWLVFYSTYAQAPDQPAFYHCDFELTNCAGYVFNEGEIATFYNSHHFFTGNRWLGLVGDGFTSVHWVINEEANRIEASESWFNFPEEEDNPYIPIDFYMDYALILTLNPYPGYEEPPRHLQIWSMTTGEKVTHRAFNGDWVGLGDYLIFSNNAMLTIFHLPDGRFTRWQASDSIHDIQINANGDLLLIITSDMLEVVALAQE